MAEVMHFTKKQLELLRNRAEKKQQVETQEGNEVEKVVKRLRVPVIGPEKIDKDPYIVDKVRNTFVKGIVAKMFKKIKTTMGNPEKKGIFEEVWKELMESEISEDNYLKGQILQFRDSENKNLQKQVLDSMSFNLFKEQENAKEEDYILLMVALYKKIGIMKTADDLGDIYKKER